MSERGAILSITRDAETIKKALRLRKDELGEKFSRGLTRAALILKRESQNRVPVDFGLLKASAFVRSRGKGIDRKVRVGYTAPYALAVHESVGMVLRGKPRPKGHVGNYWDPAPQAQAKFLEQPSRDTAIRKTMYSAIRESMAI